MVGTGGRDKPGTLTAAHRVKEGLGPVLQVKRAMR